MRVVCTAGHVDHGKSTLVKALTGMEPDRFAEEQRRGLTIDLGFAWTPLEGTAADGTAAETIAFVDLPGHERFIANMLAGAGPIELALLVVAADEGWMPQTQEHVDILDLLGVSRAVAAVTKADAVAPDEAQRTAELVRRRLAGTKLRDAEIVVVSARIGEGLDGLRNALADLIRAAPPAADLRRPRLWVDRVFTIKGAGTVATGTLGGGAIRVGDDLAVLPAGAAARVRALESLNAPITRAPPGTRVAVNLAGIGRDAVKRGDALGVSGQWLAVTEMDAWIRALPGREIGRRGDWRLHIGTAELGARILPLTDRPTGGRTDDPQSSPTSPLADRPTGGCADDPQPSPTSPLTDRPIADADGLQFARITLDHAIPAAAGDAFVLREAGRRATFGGGFILDADPPPRPRGRAARTARLEQLSARYAALSADDRALLLELHVRERGSAAADRCAAAAGLTAEEATSAARGHALVALGPLYADAASAKRWSGAAIEAVRAHQAAHPLERSAPKDIAVRAAVAAGCPPGAAPALLRAVAEAGHLAAEGPGVRTPEHRSRLDPVQSAARDALLAELRRELFRPPALAQAARAAAAPEALIRALELEGALVRMGADLAFAAEALDAAVAVLLPAYRAEGPLTAARAKDLLGTSRKYALPLLEELDRRGRTRRVGDTREVLG